MIQINCNLTPICFCSQTEEEREARYSLTSCGKLLAGGLAGALAQSVSYPLDVARLVHTYPVQIQQKLIQYGPLCL